jgi:hypothetical protein
VIDEEGDGRRKIALKRKIDSLEQEKEMPLELIRQYAKLMRREHLNISA